MAMSEARFAAARWPVVAVGSAGNGPGDGLNGGGWAQALLQSTAPAVGRPHEQLLQELHVSQCACCRNDCIMHCGEWRAVAGATEG